MDIKKQLSAKLTQVFKSCGYDCEAAVGFSNMPDLCDFQSNSAFAIAKQHGKNPIELAKSIVDACEELNNDFEISVAGPGFINFKCRDEYLSRIANELILDKRVGVEKHKKSRNVIMDYGGANVAKELHVGHLRSPIIGESLNRLFKLLGDNVTSDSHLGDWGLQMGLTEAQLEEDGVLDYYFGKSKVKPNITLDMLNEAYPKASSRKKTDMLFKEKADTYTLYIQQKQEPYYTIYKEIREASVKRIEKNYKDLNSFFDLWYGESTVADLTKSTVQLFVDKGLARVSEDALVVDVAREGEHIPLPKKDPNDPNEKVQYKNPMPPTIIQKFNGGDLYATTDLATIVLRQKMCHYDEYVYVVDKRQGMHFEQVFRCARLANIVDEDQKLTFVGFGTMNGKDGKPFKTRDGGTIKLEDIINLLKSKANEKLEANGIKGDDKLALAIGVAAMKFGDLSNMVSKDYVFDIDKFTSFEGKTGPYLQYTVARIKSLIKKANEKSGQIIINGEEQRKIMIDLLKLIDSYELCYKDYSLHTLCACTYNLASSYATLYNNVKIIKDTDNSSRKSNLALSELVAKALEQALGVLAIDVVEEM